MCQALLEIMEPEINKIKEMVKEEVTKEVTEQERQKSIRSTIVALRVCGQDDTAIKNAIIEAYGISTTEAEKYL